MRRSRIFLVVVVLVVLIAIVAGGTAVAAQAAQGPEQPVAFPHTVHVTALGIECNFCHRNVTAVSNNGNASVPPVEQCMFCHRVVTGLGANGEESPKSQEIAKVRQAFQDGTPIDWVRVHRLPDHVRFVHQAHVQGLMDRNPGMTLQQVCTTCHGDVGSMTRVHQVRPLKMGDCVSCHRQNNAPTDCTICHK